MDLILRPSGLADPQKAWSLQLRDYACQGVPPTYSTLCRVSKETAQYIIEAGAAYWLFGEPKDETEELERTINERSIPPR